MLLNSIEELELRFTFLQFLNVKNDPIVNVTLFPPQGSHTLSTVDKLIINPVCSNASLTQNHRNREVLLN